jgi:lysophospholipase L1-like esterase
MLGDSTAAGYGVAQASQTPGVLLAEGLAAAARRPVRLVNVAKVGAVSADLDAQIDLMLARREGRGAPDVAAIMIGANDVTHRVKAPEAVACLDAAVRRLRGLGSEVVVGTCPDLGTIEPVSQPLRWLTRRWSRQLAAAQTIAVVEAGGRTVSLATTLGPEFAARPRDMFGPDRFHPSAAGYATAAAVVLPSVVAAVGYAPPEEAMLRAIRGERVLPVARAAARAAERSGTEVTASAVVDERQRRTRRRSAVGAGWALLRRRVRRPVHPPADARENGEGDGTHEDSPYPAETG